MKYTRLTKEQLEELSFEFARFLAAQQIDTAEWHRLKKEHPSVAEDEIDVFSDMVWEKSLSKVEYLQRFDRQLVSVVKIDIGKMYMRSVVISRPMIDLTTTEGLQWLDENFYLPEVQLYTGEKKFEKERNVEIFELIRQGYHISDGGYYERLKF
ncbi:MAG: DUF6495 family protein [Capnocytophaga sp.]|nr:DUF6495 family protein [Capnocytophaga sp.]